MLKFRIWLANKLVKLAHIIRPKAVNELLKQVEEIYDCISKTH